MKSGDAIVVVELLLYWIVIQSSGLLLNKRRTIPAVFSIVVVSYTWDGSLTGAELFLYAYKYTIWNCFTEKNISIDINLNITSHVFIFSLDQFIILHIHPM